MNFTTCADDNLDKLLNQSAYLLLFNLNPVDDENSIWAERSHIWWLVFQIFTATYSFVFFMLGLACVVLIIKRDCLRLPTKTFLIVYISLAILGFSRGLLLALDPFGITGWIMSRFQYWSIISRLLGNLGFPSITAAYSLVLLTLYKATELGASRLWLQNWRLVASIASVHYIAALVSEGVANVAPYPAVLTIVVCDGTFILWGVAICITYLLAGWRLKRKLAEQCNKTVRNSLASLESHPPTGLGYEEYQKHYNQIAKTVRKVGLITYGTAVLGILYASVSLTIMVKMTLFVFSNCLGLNGPGDSTAWLGLQLARLGLEIPLALVMIYSVTDIRGVLGHMKSICCCCCSCCQTPSSHQTSCSAPANKPVPRKYSSQSNTTQISVLSLDHRTVQEALNSAQSSSAINTITTTIDHSETDLSVEYADV